MRELHWVSPSSQSPKGLEPPGPSKTAGISPHNYKAIMCCKTVSFLHRPGGGTVEPPGSADFFCEAVFGGAGV